MISPRFTSALCNRLRVGDVRRYGNFVPPVCRSSTHFLFSCFFVQVAMIFLSFLPQNRCPFVAIVATYGQIRPLLYSKPISFDREQILSASFIQQPLYVRSKCLTVEPYMRYLRTILFCLRTHTCNTIYEYRKYRRYVLYAHFLDSYDQVDLKPRE